MEALIMMGSIICIGGSLILALGIGAYFVFIYNKIVNLSNGIENSFNQIKVALKKRLDMISQLVESTSSMANFEKETMTKIAELRGAKTNNPAEVSNLARASGALVGQIMAVVENYPELKTNEAVKELQTSIKSVEEEIARLRYLYNDQVQTYNNLIERIPSNIIANLLGKKKKEYLKFEENVEGRPSTKF